ncbi:hypothetical protein [Microvirga massiliensis]|uniref:hypothetical protein n=1 Tax=Microvirga massiliensis TaxID=1033741 RepID=UPI00069BD703|nr:hypothetical protein [Microvirga massiliensis]
MSINWLVTVSTPYVTIPTYGNYGGPHYSGGVVLQPGQTPPAADPVDSLDALFQAHDLAYATAIDRLAFAQADLQLIRGIAGLTDAQLSDEGHLYGGATQLALVDQIENRYGHPELFGPGERDALREDALGNLAQGRPTPEANEIAAVPDLLNNLRAYAEGGAPRVDINDAFVLVDDRFYFDHNFDILVAGVDPDQHYSDFGWHEGRDPNALFSTNGYLSANADVNAADINPLDHYHQHGWREGRDASAKFDTTLYLQHNPDVKAANIDPLEHYLAFGQAEGRQIYAAVGTNIQGTFDAEFYLLANPDVGLAGVSAASHFQTFGWKEKRDPNAYFDTSAYLAANPDVAAAGVNPLDHYNTYGWKEGRDPSAAFDTSSYLAAYADVAAAGVNPLQHFLQFGIYEGRSAFADGAIT